MTYSASDRKRRTAALIGASVQADPPRQDVQAGPPGYADIPGVVNASQLAALLGIGARAVHLAAADGRIERLGENRFDTRATVARYCEGLRQRKAGSTLEVAKERLTRAQADRAEVIAARERGELVPLAQVRAEWVTTATDLRAALLAIPSRVASRLGLDRVKTAELDAEIRAALEEIAADPRNRGALPVDCVSGEADQ